MNEMKLNEIKDLIESIKSKTLNIMKKTESLNNLNIILELFLNSWDAYSIERPINYLKKNSDCKKNNKNQIKSKEIVNEIEKEIPNQNNNINFKEKINLIFNVKKAHKEIANQIYRLLELNGIVSLENIVKGIKMSKYRVIEILNILVKNKIVYKYFEKEFQYKLNNEE